MPYERHNLGTSTFTITDSGGAFTNFLIQWGYVRAALWSENPTYHINVLVSTKGVMSDFYLDPLQVKKVGYTLSVDWCRKANGNGRS
jgi:hypothetical protein